MSRNSQIPEVVKSFCAREMSNRKLLHKYVATQRQRAIREIWNVISATARAQIVYVCVCSGNANNSNVGMVTLSIVWKYQLHAFGYFTSIATLPCDFFTQFLIAICTHTLYMRRSCQTVTRGNCRVVPAFGADKLF